MSESSLGGVATPLLDTRPKAAQASAQTTTSPPGIWTRLPRPARRCIGAGIAILFIGGAARIVAEFHAMDAANGAKARQVEADKAEAARQQAEAEDRQMKERSAKAEAAAAARLQSVTAFAAMAPGAREVEIRNCVAFALCDKELLAAMLETVTSEPERKKLRATSFAAAIGRYVEDARDGEQVSAAPVANISRVLGQEGLAPLDRMNKVSLGEAMKDPQSARGKVARASGTVAEIQREGSVFVGSVVTDEGRVVRFVTPLSTDGIVAGSWTRFRGVFVQEYDYENVARGQTKSLLLVGGVLRDE